MSGFRGTIGSPKNDKVIAFIYDRIEHLKEEHRNRILTTVQRMHLEHAQINTIPDLAFRKQVAKLLAKDVTERVNSLIETILFDHPTNPSEEVLEHAYNVLDIKSRLHNLIKRHYSSKL